MTVTTFNNKTIFLRFNEKFNNGYSCIHVGKDYGLCRTCLNWINTNIYEERNKNEP